METIKGPAAQGSPAKDAAERSVHGGQLCPYGHCNTCLNVTVALRAAEARGLERAAQHFDKLDADARATTYTIVSETGASHEETPNGYFLSAREAAKAIRALGDSEVLRAVRAKIEHGWCQYYYAKDSNGERVPPDSPTATCWCILGAYRAVTHDKQRAPFRFVDNALRGTGYSFADDWQDADGRTQADVLALIDKAIALAEGTAPKAPSVIASDSTAPDNEGDDP